MYCALRYATAENWNVTVPLLLHCTACATTSDHKTMFFVHTLDCPSSVQFTFLNLHLVKPLWSVAIEPTEQTTMVANGYLHALTTTLSPISVARHTVPPSATIKATRFQNQAMNGIVPIRGAWFDPQLTFSPVLPGISSWCSALPGKGSR